MGICVLVREDCAQYWISFARATIHFWPDWCLLTTTDQGRPRSVVVNYTDSALNKVCRWTRLVLRVWRCNWPMEGANLPCKSVPKSALIRPRSTILWGLDERIHKLNLICVISILNLYMSASRKTFLLLIFEGQSNFIALQIQVVR